MAEVHENGETNRYIVDQERPFHIEQGEQARHQQEVDESSARRQQQNGIR